MNFLPRLVFAATLGNIVYLSLISLLPNISLPAEFVVGLRLLTVSAVYYLLRGYWQKMETKFPLEQLVIFLPYLVILLLRFSLLYPTYDDLAVHFMWGDYANRLWQNQNFMPLEFLTYFYLPYDMHYTPFLYTIGIRLTIWLFFGLTTVWLASLYLRLGQLTKTKLQKLFLAVVFIMLPFIPHMMAVQGTLMLEYFTIPFVLEALYQCMREGKDKTFAAITVLTALLIKQSHAVFVAPLLIYYLWAERKKIRWTAPITLALVASVFFIRLYLETGNPLSGLFNGWFKSSLYAPVNFSQPLFGPKNWWETVAWPIMGQFTDRYAEGIVSNLAKISFPPISAVPYLAAIYFMIIRRSAKYATIVLSYLVWSILVGYARYYIALNAMSLIAIILDLTRPDWNWLTRRSKWVLIGVALLSLSSTKTDFSWRPNPSLRTPAANAYYLQKYQEGLVLVGKDTLPAMADYYKPLLAGYDAVVTVYRGPATMLSYMGYLNGLPVYEALTPDKYQHILADKRVSESIKANLEAAETHKRVIMLVDNSYKQYATAWQTDSTYQCEAIGPAPTDPYFQRPDYYGETILYECHRI